MTTKIDRSPSLTSTPKAQPVSRTQLSPAAEVEARLSAAPPAPGFVAQAESRPGALPPAAHVSRSADPGALWGTDAPRRNRHLDLTEFRRLPPEERKAKFEAMRAQREQLKGEIQDRVNQLDRKWKYSHLRTRTASLRDLQAKKPELTAEQQQRFEAALRSAESADQKVKALAEKAQAFAPESKKDPVQLEARKKLASELRKARAEHSSAVAAATAVIDEAGLKVDRLANAEQVLDKNAPPPGSGKSLWDKIVSFFDLTFSLKSYSTVMESVNDFMGKVREHLSETGKSDLELALHLRRQRERDRDESNVEQSRAEQLKSLAP
ncbi:MAG: hypothetical protein IT380_22345 [Myxococcales bacterium]|nr:hypothetical protein [Myxococcales bacterium]